MQLYAQDAAGKRIFVRDAKRGQDYFCLECEARVRARSGANLRAHFFHSRLQRSCRQAGKSASHIAVQRLIREQIGQERTIEEMRFGEIGRVADVAWPEKKWLFEVQCSPISALEVEERMRDYARLGYQVIWILHDKTFNRRLLAAAELFLQSKTHYFTDGLSIYDECQLIWQHQRAVRSCRAIVNLETMSEIQFQTLHSAIPKALQQRLVSWTHFADADHLWSACKTHDESWLLHMQKLAQRERSLNRKFSLLQPLERIFIGIRSLWHFILERSCY